MTTSYPEAVKVARDLIGPEALAEGFANEYTRGAVELLADCFGRPGIFLEDRKEEVLSDLRTAEGHTLSIVVTAVVNVNVDADTHEKRVQSENDAGEAVRGALADVYGSKNVADVFAETQ